MIATNMHLIKLLIIFFFFFIGRSQAQEKRQLKIGDRVPEIVFENVHNYKNKKAKISDFGGKLVILDMWNTSCSSCIAFFPELEKLQTTFKDKIQVLLADPNLDNSETEEKILSVLVKLKKRTGFYPTLPIPILDTVLNDYFPHKSVPHDVWINAEGVIVAITSTAEVNEKNIHAVLNGEKINLPVKDDFGYDISIPLFVNGNGGNGNDFVYRSLITKFNQQTGWISEGLRVNASGKRNGYYVFNVTLRYLTGIAYSDSLEGLPSNRIIFDVKNPEHFKNTYDTNNLYNYDLSFPPTDHVNIGSYLKEDIKRVFNISLHKEKRIIKSYIITANKEINRSFTKFKEESADVDTASIKKYYHNYSFATIILYFNQIFDKPFIDEADLKQKIDIDFPDNMDLRDMNAVIQSFKKAGLDFHEEERVLEVAVITDK